MRMESRSVKQQLQEIAIICQITDKRSVAQ